MVVIADRQLRLRHLPAARAALARTSSTRGCRARRAFLANNWILLFAAFFMLFATMFPTLSEALFRTSASRVGPPFFNMWMVPIGLTLLFLTGVGPLHRLAQGDAVEPALPVHDPADRDGVRSALRRPAQARSTPTSACAAGARRWRRWCWR